MRILLAVSPGGLLRGFQAEGHAGTALKGRNIACAAATALLRTTGQLCAEHAIVREGSAEKPGQMRLVLSPGAEAETGWLKGVTDFLLRGMKELQDEFPR